MEDDPVIKALARKFLDPRDMLGREIRTQADDHRAASSVITSVFSGSSDIGLLLGSWIFRA